MDELVLEPRDEGGRSIAVSALLHACVLGLAFLAAPGTPALALHDAWTSPPHARITVMREDSPSPSLSSSPSPSLSSSPSPSPSPSPSLSLSLSPRETGLAALAALAGALRASTADGPAFLAADALALPTSDAAPLAPIGLDMIGTGRGAGIGDGGTIGAPESNAASGLGGLGASCSDGELERRTARFGRVAAIASCSGANSSGAFGVGALGRRVVTRGAPDALEAMPEHHWHCGCGELEASGALSREAIRRVVARHRAEIRACYERALVARPDLEGRATVQFAVSPDGRVARSELDGARSDLRSSAVESCITSAVSRWTFPAAGGPTLVSYPFVLGVAAHD